MSRANRADSGVGRRKINVAWPAPEAQRLRHLFLIARSTYRGHKEHAGEVPRLTASAFYAAAYLRSRSQSALWLGDVRPARWGAPTTEPYIQVILSWEIPVIEALQDDFERLDMTSHLLWGGQFRLTKAHLLLAAIQFGTRSVDDWLSEVPNDPRCGPRTHDAVIP